MEVDEGLEGMLHLVDFDFQVCNDDESESEESEDDESETSDDDEDESGNEAGDEEVWVNGEVRSLFGSGYAKWVRKAIKQMYSTRYEEPRNKPVPCPLAQMPHTLEMLKDEGPDLFCKICGSHHTHLTNSMRR